MKALSGSITRRGFLQTSATISGGLMLGVSLNAMSDRQAEATGMVNESSIGFFVRIEPDGRVIIGSPQPEMGQGVKTSLPMLIAEELDVDWSSVAVEQMPLGLTRDAEGNLAWLHVGQGAGGSTSVSDSWQPLREAGATARLMLLQAAAQRWQLPVAELTTEPGIVLHAGSNQSLNYGELAVEAAKLPLPETAPALKSREQFKIIGHPTKVVDGRDIVMGTAQYGIDAELPGQVYAVMERCPWHDGTLKSLDDTEAKKVPGVLDVLPLKGPEPGEP